MITLARINDFCKPYTAFEALTYDRFVAPAVLNQIECQPDVGIHELVSEVPRDGRVIDVGCGGGHLAVRLAELRPDITVAGVDLSELQIGWARQRAKRFASGRVELRVGDVLDLPFEDEVADVVMSVASIKHWTDRRRGLEECLRVLRPGGVLVVVELDRGCRFEDAMRFVNQLSRSTPLPKQLLVMGFRTFVAGQSIDLLEARELAAEVDLDDPLVERVSGMPTLMIRARKPL